MTDATDGESIWDRLRRRKVVQWGIAGITLGLLAACGQASHDPATSATAGAAKQSSLEEPVVNFANFIEEIAPQTLPEFTRETGIAVNCDTYELNQVLESRLLAGSTGLDLVVPSNSYLERLEDLAAAMRTLMTLRPYVRQITSSTVTRQLVEGEACIAVGVNGDFHMARMLARESGRSANIRYVIPKEGALLWVDVLAIPADATHPENAHRLI